MIRGTSSGADDVIGNGKCVLSGHLREAIWMIASKNGHATLVTPRPLRSHKGRPDHDLFSDPVNRTLYHSSCKQGNPPHRLEGYFHHQPTRTRNSYSSNICQNEKILENLSTILFNTFIYRTTLANTWVTTTSCALTKFPMFSLTGV